VPLPGGAGWPGKPRSRAAPTPALWGVPPGPGQPWGAGWGGWGGSGIALGSWAEVSAQGRFLFQMWSGNRSVLESLASLTVELRVRLLVYAKAAVAGLAMIN